MLELLRLWGQFEEFQMSSTNYATLDFVQKFSIDLLS